LGNFLKKVPQAPQKLPEKTGKNRHIAFFKWVNRLHLSFFKKFLKFLETFSQKVSKRGAGAEPMPDKSKFEESN